MQRENPALALAAGRCLIIAERKENDERTKENDEGCEGKETDRPDAVRLHSYLSQRGFEGTQLTHHFPLSLAPSFPLSLSLSLFLVIHAPLSLPGFAGECLQSGTLKSIRLAIRASPARLCFLGFLGTPPVRPQRFRRLLLIRPRSPIFMLVLTQNGHEWLESIKGLERVFLQTVVLQNDNNKRRPPPFQELSSMFVTNWIRCVTYQLPHAQFIRSLRPMRPVFSDGEKTTGEETRTGQMLIRPLATESPELAPIFHHSHLSVSADS